MEMEWRWNGRIMERKWRPRQGQNGIGTIFAIARNVPIQ
jgi:hypothetical protein